MTLVDSLQSLSIATEISPGDTKSGAPKAVTSCTTNQPTACQTHGHRVQFYHDEEHLFKVVSDFLEPFFDHSEASLTAVILARPGPIRYIKYLFMLRGYKRTSLEQEQEYGAELLEQCGYSIGAGRRYILLVDGLRVLETLVQGGEINVQDFEKVMHQILSQFPPTQANDRPIQPPIYAYGELVDILCERGQHLLAFELEEIWNCFLATRDIALLCGYRLGSFRDQSLAAVFHQICRTHTTVSPTESYSTLCTPEEQMAMVAALQQNVVALQAAIDQRPQRSKLEEQQMLYREQFVDILCHELRNPVSGITGNVELLQAGLAVRQAILHPIVGGRDEPELSRADVASLRNQLVEDTESIDAIAISAEHMKILTDDLLSLSKLECGKVVLESLPFDPKATIFSVIKMFSTLAKKKGIQLLSDLPEEVPPIIGDAGRVAQVVINLISNALKFTETGSITVGFRSIRRRYESSIFEVSVRDTGKGISPDEKRVLFHRFTQPSSTSFAKYGGSGLGLYISKCLVELMGGVLYVESQQGKGSTFTFTFKAAESVTGLSPILLNGQQNHRNDNDTAHSDRKAPSPPTSSADRSRRGSSPAPTTNTSPSLIKKVLIVDDNPINQRVVSRLLEAKAISVTTASNGYEAIGKLINLFKSNTPVDMVLMDLDMPFMDGVRATREIRSLTDVQTKFHISSKLSKVTIIGITGHVSKEKFANARLAGMDDCIGKPIAGKVLFDLINRVQNRRLTSSPV